MEIWKDIEGYENYYQVSNYGNVRSLDRHIDINGTLILLKGKMKHKSDTGRGYLITRLSKNGKIETVKIH